MVVTMLDLYGSDNFGSPGFGSLGQARSGCWYSCFDLLKFEALTIWVRIKEQLLMFTSIFFLFYLYLNIYHPLIYFYIKKTNI
jgi:hypothetical protein